jgi:hypothetical protein
MNDIAGHSPIWWAAIIGILVMVGIDLFGSDPDWTDYGIIALIIVSIFARPGGVMRKTA